MRTTVYTEDGRILLCEYLKNANVRGAAGFALRPPRTVSSVIRAVHRGAGSVLELKHTPTAFHCSARKATICMIKSKLVGIVAVAL